MDLCSLGQQYVNQYEALKLGVNTGPNEEEQPEHAVRGRTLRQEALSSLEEAYGMAKEHLDTASGKERVPRIEPGRKEDTIPLTLPRSSTASDCPALLQSFV